MEQFTEGNGKMIKLMGKANSGTPTEIDMKANLLTPKLQATAITTEKPMSTLMGTNMKAIGKTIKRTGKVLKLWTMEASMKETSKTE